MTHHLHFSADYDLDGFKVICPGWIWPIDVIMDGEPRFCPWCGFKLPEVKRGPSLG